MKAFWAKITAWFMAIVAFFTGLFSGGNSQPPEDPIPEPTSAVVQPTEPTSATQQPTQEETTQMEQTEIRYGVPAPNVSDSGIVCESAGGTVIGRYENAAQSDFAAYTATLRSAGYQTYDENEIDANFFASFYKGDTAVYVSWFSRTGTLRVIAEPKGELPPLADTAAGAFNTLLTGMKGETVVASEGMGYIIRLCDGSFLIIDGGMGDPDRVDADKLMNILNAQKPADAEKPVIAAWIFTHLHGDHIGVFNCFSLAHHDDVIIERLYFNFPKETEIAASDSPYMLDDTIYRYTQFQKNLADFYADVPVVKPHTGSRFAVRNASLEVLYAYDDLYPQTILNGGMNENSLLLKMTVAGQTILWTGDFAFNATALVLREYETALQADMLQMAHHGMNGTVALYSAVNPTYALLPVWHGGLSGMLQKPQNQWLQNSEKMRQMIVTGCGTWTIQLPYNPAPGSFERIPTEDTVYPTYPDLLGG